MFCKTLPEDHALFSHQDRWGLWFSASLSERHGSLTPHDFSMQTHIESESLPLHAATELGPCQQIFRIGPLLGFKEDTAWVWSPWSKTLLSMAWMASLGPKLFKRPVLQGILIGTSREVLTFRPWQVGSANGPMGDIYIYIQYMLMGCL